MVCYHPIPAYYALGVRNPATGKQGITFKASERDPSKEAFKIPCGQCIGCRLDRSRVWAVRCMHEAQEHRQNCFVTFTYDDRHLPKNGSLYPDDMTNLLKRIRNDFSLRYFQCGEYGELYQRPHHHALFFGFRPPDLKFYRMRNGFRLYTSEYLSKKWENKGFVVIGDVSFESAAYTARYCLKKVTGKDAEDHYRSLGIIPEYVTMSRRPGIGRSWFEKWKSDIYERAENEAKIYTRGDIFVKPPRYYDSLYDVISDRCHDRLMAIKAANLERHELESTGSEFQDALVLERKEEYKKQRTKELKRGLEDIRHETNDFCSKR